MERNTDAPILLANENQSRVISGAVTGIFLNGDSLTNTASVNAAKTALTNASINAVARVGPRLTNGYSLLAWDTDEE